AMHNVLEEIRSRLHYLVTVGLGYLTLNRQSRTLSGGEVQRINLTTALGTSLVNTLFVLDEPSIGLHPRDMSRVIDVIERLRDAGNTLLVVEHDAQVMLAADRIVDMGPGPGDAGGEVVFFGTTQALLKHPSSLTAQYLRADRLVATPNGRDVALNGEFLEIRGAAQNNLRGVNAQFPIGHFSCVTGISGSGKSTLIEDVVYRGLKRLHGVATETPGAHESIHNHGAFAEVVFVDQSPIGKTTRATPASYVGALTVIRTLFARLPLSVERKYTPGTFSFNSGNGRCPTCGGNGFEHVEMQFLSDVYLRCDDCDGTRYRAEILEVTITDEHGGGQHKSIADVLNLTVEDALVFFGHVRELARTLAPLQAVGLGYLKLGQPVPTLSGGEAQRLKLAGYLAKHRVTSSKRQAKAKSTPSKAAANTKSPVSPSLFLFDEPTTGLHFDDIRTLLQAFEQLLDAGHTLIVIEHNLDVICSADWIVDLGPEAGENGGEIVAQGPPSVIREHPTSATGAAMRAFVDAQGAPATVPHRKRRAASGTSIEVVQAREHNLRGINASIPKDALTVITGVSGSGKSTLAFDIVFAEGQRRYLESLNAYARQFVQPASRADVDAVHGIPPTVAIEQRTSRGGQKSTVATMTESYHFMRVLWLRLGQQYCPDCHIPVHAQPPEAILASITREYRGRVIWILAPLVVARKGYYTELARWAAGKGFTQLRVDGQWTPTDAWPRLKRYSEHDIELGISQLEIKPGVDQELHAHIEQALGFSQGLVQVISADEQAPSKALYSTHLACPTCARSFAEPDPRMFSFNSRHGWCPGCHGSGLAGTVDADLTHDDLDASLSTSSSTHPALVCPVCRGARLCADSLAVQLHERSIAEVSALSVDDAEQFFRTLKLNKREAAIGKDLLAELLGRLRFLSEVGLGYLPLARAAPTLSGGEAQRIRLAASLGSNLQGVCYILDEPTIGLHPRDNAKLLDTLERLQAQGNAVVIVEHDEDTIRRASHIIDLGPGAGVDGGEVVAHGSLDTLLRSERSVTGRMLANPPVHPYISEQRTMRNIPALTVVRAALHNLRNIDVSIPLQRVVTITGVSGSGKSTLIREVLLTSARNILDIRAGKGAKSRNGTAHGCASLEGLEVVDRVLEVDQTPIGKTPRSCPATYIGFWDYIRRLFADTTEARIRGFGPGRFSFNVSGGRCDACQGQGQQRIEMNFLPDVRVMCEECAGARFNEETLAVRYYDKTIADVLAMNAEQAALFFKAHRTLAHPLTLLCDVGLGYLTLGQQSPTLSGGEAQRIKLVTELAKARTAPQAPMPQGQRAAPRRLSGAGHTLYVLDEPTIGLHMADVERLVRVLHRLAGAGHSVLVIEHNLDVIAESDWLIDLGPEGGTGGGKVVAQGTPATLSRRKRATHTSRALSAHLASRVARG
ncbi:MAG: excinuclease ABC subunit A, partial [Gammaproteobacteria bacterium]